jgi:pilus assembly protein CpaB
VRLRAIAIASTVAFLGAALVFFYLHRFEKEASGGDKIAILYLSRAIEAGGELRNDALGERWIPHDYVEERAIRTVDRQRILGLRVSSALQAQQVLNWSDIALASESSLSAADLVQPGMRAFVIHADNKSAALVGAGNRIDILGTFDIPGGNRQSSVLLQNILVLARGNSGNNGAGNPDANDVALSVTLPDAEMLALAGEKGHLSVALREDSNNAVLNRPPIFDGRQLLDIDPAKAPRGPAGPSGPVRF